jgi:hypothetical protein
MPTKQNKMPQTMLMTSRMTKSKTETYAKHKTTMPMLSNKTRPKQELMQKTHALQNAAQKEKSRPSASPPMPALGRASPSNANALFSMASAKA